MAMLQFGRTMCNVVSRVTSQTIWRINLQQSLALSSSAASVPERASVVDKPRNPVQQPSRTKQNKPKIQSKNELVQAAFTSILNDWKPTANVSPNSPMGEKIAAATTVDELLSLVGKEKLSQADCLSIISVLSKWTNKNKVTLAEYENEPRFLLLCRQLIGFAEASSSVAQVDFKTVLSLAGDDEAAKLIATLSVNQMTKVFSTLAFKRRRSLPILRSLSYHISRSTDKINAKQCSDILFSMAVLNFPDEILLGKVISGLISHIRESNVTPVIGSVATSLGFLRYKNIELLDALCEWFMAEPRTLKPQYITSLLLTFATVDYVPFNMTELNQTYIKPLNETDVSASETWLDVVWSTVILGIADPVKVAYTLDTGYIQKLTALQCLTTPRKVKLLNINAAAELLIPNYKGPFLNKDLNLDKMLIERSKEKQAYVTSVQDALSNLFTVPTCLNVNENSGMGFVIDAECYVDNKCNPVPIKQAQNLSNVTRIAVLGLHYNDFCRGAPDYVGIYSLMVRLLEAKGYKVVLVPYTEFNPQDKLVTRLKYLQKLIRSTVQPSST